MQSAGRYRALGEHAATCLALMSQLVSALGTCASPACHSRMTPDLSPLAWQALDELYQARLEGSPPIRISSAASAELQGNGLAIELPDGTLEITLSGSQSWEERERLGRS